MGRKALKIEDYGGTMDELYNLYVNTDMNSTSLSKRYGVSRTTVNRWLKELGVELKNKRQILFNEFFFDEIDCEEKAYWLGFLWTDGSVSWSREVPKIQIGLQGSDSEHLKKFAVILNSNAKVNIYQNKHGIQKSKDLTVAKINLHSKHMGTILRDKYGMVSYARDYFKLSDSIPKKFLRHFFRGVFDADGSFWITNKKNGTPTLALSICTNEDFCRHFHDSLYDLGLTQKSFKIRNRHEKTNGGGSARELSYSGWNQCLGILNYLYGHSTVYLNRKWLNFHKILELRESQTFKFKDKRKVKDYLLLEKEG